MPFGSRLDQHTQAFERAEQNRDHYVVRVNTGRLDVERQTDTLNDLWRRGWALTFIFEQSGNTVFIYEHGSYDESVPPPSHLPG